MRVELKMDGEPLLNWSGKPEDLSTHHSWNRLKPRRLGLAAHDVKITYRDVRIRRVEAGAAQPTSPTPLPSTSLSPKQTIDLLALADPVRDRVPSSMGGANVWKKAGSVLSYETLSYETDGKAGKIASPVGLVAKTYEIEVAFRRRSVGDRFHIDLPVSDKVILPLEFGRDKNKIVLGGATIGTYDPLASALSGRVVVRVEPGNGNASKVTTWFDAKQTGEWTGNLASIAKNANEPHPDFPGQPITTLWCAKDSYEFTTWVLRLFDGEAKVLRKP